MTTPSTKRLLFSVTKDDFDMWTFSVGGHGGSGKGTSNSGVRLIHRASGAVGEGREHRSNTQNRRSSLGWKFIGRARAYDQYDGRVWLTYAYEDTGYTVTRRVRIGWALAGPVGWKPTVVDEARVSSILTLSASWMFGGCRQRTATRLELLGRRSTAS